MIKKPHPAFDPWMWLTAGVAAVAIAASVNLDGPDDIAAAADQTAELTALQAAEPGSQAQLAAARVLCQQECGPGAKALWLPDGSLVCRAAPLAVAQEGSL